MTHIEFDIPSWLLLLLALLFLTGQVLGLIAAVLQKRLADRREQYARELEQIEKEQP